MFLNERGAHIVDAVLFPFCAAALCFWGSQWRPVWGLIGYACTVVALLLAFALAVDLSDIAAGLLGLLICLLQPGREDRA